MLNQWTGRATRQRLPPLRRLMIPFLGLLLLTGACPGSLFSQALSRYVKSSDAEAIEHGRRSWTLNRVWPHGLRYVVAGLARLVIHANLHSDQAQF